MVYMAFQSVFFGPVGAAAAGLGYTPGKAETELLEAEVELSKLVPASALNLPIELSWAAANACVPMDCIIFSAIRSSTYLSRLLIIFMLWKLCEIAAVE